MITSFPPAYGGGQEGISTILGHDPFLCVSPVFLFLFLLTCFCFCAKIFWPLIAGYNTVFEFNKKF
ncbi:MAG: hypothetical protein LBR79_07435 [Oscillospiraceae bacterium]|nr:hypothetical protein [Oscillospiraceae bacterium]